MTNIFVSKLIKEIFGQDASLIHYDEDSRLVISNRYSESVGGDNIEYMVHHFIYREEDGKGFLENGNYLHSFDQAILCYLQRKNIKPKIVVPISEEDLSDLQNGEQFEWTFKSNGLISIDVLIKGEEDGDHE
jgi:hypothetical protein